VSDLVRLEGQFDRELPRPRLAGPPPRALVEAARAWSEAVWAEAARLGPMPMREAEAGAGLALAARPVCITGSHRSGTTLMRDLLDGHPALVVLPSEGTYFTALERPMRRLPSDEQCGWFAREWLRRLANPINQPPYWTLGRSTREGSGYVDFARRMQAWWPRLERASPAGAPWPLAAAALAYAGVRAASGSPRRWVEKTPAAERWLRRLWTAWPEAKVVQLVRHPEAVASSRKRMEERAGTFAWGPALAELRRSYRTAARHRDLRHALPIRYEDLIASRGETMERVARFLEIESTSEWPSPTVAGMPAESNTSFPEGPRAVLTDAERRLVSAVVGADARALGYTLAEAGWRDWLRARVIMARRGQRRAARPAP
jgi:hypothetical protein